MVPFRELFNEYYPRDTSKKIRAVFTAKGNSGQRLCTHVPYGYTGNKYCWEVDEDAAAVVRQIFEWCVAGLGPSQIAKRLKAQRVQQIDIEYNFIGKMPDLPQRAMSA